MRASMRLFPFAAAFCVLALAGSGIPASAQTIILNSPTADEILSPAAAPRFEWTATGTFELFQIQISLDDMFTAGPSTVTYPRLAGTDKTSVRVDASTWKRVVGKVVDTNGVIYWRVRGVTDGAEIVISESRRALVTNAANAGEVDLLMRQEDLRESDEFRVAMLANSGAQELGGVSVRVTYNPNVLELVGGETVNGMLGGPYIQAQTGGSLFVSFMNMPKAEPEEARGLVPLVNLMFRVLDGTAGGTAGMAGSVLTIGTRGTVVDPEPKQPWADTPRPTFGGGALSIMGG